MPMKYSQLFGKTTRNVPKDEIAANAILLTRAGFIYKVMAGVYAYTPLGLRVLEKIKQVVREEMNAIGGQELIMSSLQRKDTWDVTGRWSDEVVDVWFKSKLKDETEVGFGWSHEEAIIEMAKQQVVSYRDLPMNLYQFQTKMRNELRAKSGIMRGREFVMKDMYSFSIDEYQHEAFYESAKQAYMKVYDRLGLGDDTYVTFASGGAFTQFSHEFQTVCEAGEDVIYLHKEKGVAINEEVLNEETLANLGVAREELVKIKTAEVGNIFNFGTQKSEQMDFSYTNADGQKQYVHLGSYGIGITRVMGVIAEKFHDDRGLLWPEVVAPYTAHVVSMGNDEAVRSEASALVEELEAAGVEVLWDDRDVSAGVKMGDADLIGLPWRIVVSARTMEQEKLEVKKRTQSDSVMMTRPELLAQLS